MSGCCAGHVPVTPRPLLLRGDRAIPPPVAHRGPMTGRCRVTVTRRCTESRDVLLLYTDGVVERRGRDITDGISSPTQSLTVCAGRSRSRSWTGRRRGASAARMTTTPVSWRSGAAEHLGHWSTPLTRRRPAHRRRETRRDPR
ncbi:SpoIIE family protein phosphatase [Streptomyces xantholiticus]|uniref:SpoIIE family protein phosphatase n=1 Tax=Streptomyces xantholiticus TaxID=68285 RepID=A0ABV1UP50_9ACTN